jgi:uncharacterized protein (TIGR03435 family)
MPRALALAAWALSVVAIHAQPAGGQAAFAAATIRRSGPDSPAMSIRHEGQRLTTSNMPLPRLIAWAFDIDEARLVDVPKGLDTFRYDIVAKAPGDRTVPGGVQLMMRTLLAERFQLRVHHQMRDMTSFVLLTAEPRGSRLQPSSANETGPNPFRMTAAGVLEATHASAGMLAKVLANQLGRPVEDNTGLAGFYDFTLRWRPDTTDDRTIDPSAPSLTTALREQLGLRLDARKTSVDVLVVDHVDARPAEN